MSCMNEINLVVGEDEKKRRARFLIMCMSISAEKDDMESTLASFLKNIGLDGFINDSKVNYKHSMYCMQ